VRMKLLVTVLLATFLTAACSFAAGQAASNSKPTGGRLFVTSFMTMHDPFFVELNEGIKSAVEAHGDRLLFLDGKHEREIQEKNTIDALKLHPAAIFLIPATDLGSIDKILAAAKAQNVPVILVDTDVDAPDSLILTKVITDNLAAGRLDARELAKVNPRAKVGVLSFSLSKGCVDRVNGFSEELAKHPEMKILATQDGHANADGVRGVIKDFLAKHPEMDAIFAINDVSAIEALAGIESAGRTGKIAVLGVGGQPAGAQLVKDGKMLASTAQMPKEIGRVAVAKVYDHLAGKRVEKKVLVPVKLVTRANADQFLQ
jgi:ribose transport system substrate-binding protein